MSNLSVADELAFENLPDEVKEIAKKYYEGRIEDLEDEIDRIKDDGDDRYQDGYDDGYSEGQDSRNSEVSDLEERIEELKAQLEEKND